MKKAVITTGGKQYIVSEGETIDVELLKSAEKSVDGVKQDSSLDGLDDGKPVTHYFEALLTIDGDKVNVGAPFVSKVKVSAEVLQADIQADKVTSIRYKAKKRVHKVRGHRQHLTTLKITKIT